MERRLPYNIERKEKEMEEFLKEHGFEYNSNDENLMEAALEGE